jgi:hypothetical protein
MKFRAELVRPEGVGTWTFVAIPKKVSAPQQLRSHQRVRGTMDGVPFTSSLIPRGGRELFVVVNGALREQIGKRAGEEVVIVMELDRSPVVISIPPQLQRALARDAAVRARFETLAPSHRKAFAQWIAEAKQESTRERRLAKTLEMVRRGERLK